MEHAIATVTQNDKQSAKAPAREVIKIADFEQLALEDVHNMFGTWKETDHCDKDIRN